MNIREANSNDIDDICRLLSVLFEQESEFKPEYEVQKKGVGEILSNKEVGRFFVIEDSGKIVGAVSLLFLVSTALGGKVALLEDMILEKNSRGKGLGTKLLDYVIRYAIRNGFLRITVLVDEDNIVAHSFYKKMGFKYSSMIPMRLVL